MTNTIWGEDEDGKEAEIILSDEDYDNHNFIDLIVGDKQVSVSIEDLHCALMSFVIKKDRIKE